MGKILMTGGSSLQGDISVSGAKNAVLPILCATLLADSPVQICNVPQLQDVRTMMHLLTELGMSIQEAPSVSGQGMTLVLDAKGVHQYTAPYALVRTMRASILVLAPLLARYKCAEVSLPGGCAIGSRPIDQHIKGLKALGAQITVKNGYIKASCPHGLKGGRVVFDVISVTGTENVLMAAALAEGETTIENAAMEPEVVDLATCLISMGAHITGAGTPHIRVKGMHTLHGTTHSVLPDRIETGTFLVAAAMTGGHVRVHGTRADTLDTVLDKLIEAGAHIQSHPDWIALDMRGKRPSAVNITTAPYPGFPTDMQAQFMAMNCISDGVSVIHETIFENRFMHVNELLRLGAKIQIEGHTAVVQGVNALGGAPVMATDLRASASLVLAGLVAHGETTIDRIYHLDRGYDAIVQKLQNLGATITRQDASLAHCPDAHTNV